eukprot:4821041-Amphidinium_carterae.2
MIAKGSILQAVWLKLANGLFAHSCYAMAVTIVIHLPLGATRESYEWTITLSEQSLQHVPVVASCGNMLRSVTDSSDCEQPQELDYNLLSNPSWNLQQVVTLFKRITIVRTARCEVSHVP